MNANDHQVKKEGGVVEEKDYINNLPAEILVKILSYLSKNELIKGPAFSCKNLNTLCQLEDEEMDLVEGKSLADNDEAKLFNLAMSLGIYNKLRILKVLIVDHRWLDMAFLSLKRCPNIERLEIDGQKSNRQCRSADYGVLYDKLIKPGVTIVLHHFNLNGGLDYFPSLRGLTHVELHGCVVSGFNWISQNWCRLEVLSLIDCTGRGKYGGIVLGYKVIKFLSESVKELHLSKVSLRDDVFSWVWRCRQLEKLTIFGAKQEKLRLLENGLKLQKLEFLKLESCDDLVLNGVAEKCPELRSIDIGMCYSGSVKTDEGVRSVMRKCPKLEKINISESAELTKDAFSNVRDLLPNLAEIRLENCSKFSKEAGKDFELQMVDLGIKAEVLTVVRRSSSIDHLNVFDDDDGGGYDYNDDSDYDNGYHYHNGNEYDEDDYDDDE